LTTGGATADFQVCAKDLTTGAVELLGEATCEIDTDAAMVRTFTRHGVNAPIEVLVALLGRTLQGEILLNRE
jgi:hypothetical protein